MAMTMTIATTETVKLKTSKKNRQCLLVSSHLLWSGIRPTITTARFRPDDHLKVNIRTSTHRIHSTYCKKILKRCCVHLCLGDLGGSNISSSRLLCCWQIKFGNQRKSLEQTQIWSHLFSHCANRGTVSWASAVQGTDSTIAQCAGCKVYFSAQPNNLKLILNFQKY